MFSFDHERERDLDLCRWKLVLDLMRRGLIRGNGILRKT